MGTMAEITTLVMYSPKREQLLGNIQANIELENEDDQFDEQFNSLSKLCTSRWTIRATAMGKVIVNYQPLYDLWESCLEERLDRETCSRIIGCQSQMSEVCFFFGLSLAHTVHSLTDNLLETLQKEKLSSSEGKSVAMKTVETFQNMRSESSADLFFDIVSRKASSLMSSQILKYQERERILTIKHLMICLLLMIHRVRVVSHITPKQ